MPVFLAVLAAACGGGGDASGPPRIVFGEDACAHCKMIISDERFAAGAVAAASGGRPRTVAFDDLGCLLAYLRARGEGVRAAYVKDYETRRWLRAARAFYLRSAKLHTPMASGLAAAATRAAAARLARKYPGEILDWRTVRERE